MVEGLSTVVVKVALTGGIATGKSYVLARLTDRGIPTIDADDVVHAALGRGTATTRAIATQFGTTFLKADGSVDRKLVAEKVFADPVARRQLEAIVHPAVYAAILSWFDTLNTALGVASIPLLYETGRERDFDVVVVTACQPEVQLQRLMERDGLSGEQARQRIAAQMPAEDKAARGQFVIRTEGSTANTDRQVEELIEALDRRR
jgi:dephospho-CoA kinase